MAKKLDEQLDDEAKRIQELGYNHKLAYELREMAGQVRRAESHLAFSKRERKKKVDR